MKNKLLNKLEHETHAAYIKQIWWVGSEALQERSSLMEFFYENLEGKQIAEVFGFQHAEEIITQMFDKDIKYKETELLHELCEAGKDGFFAYVNVPIHVVYFDKNGIITGSNFSEGLCHIAYAYGDTLDDLVNTIINLSNKLFEHDAKRSRLQKKTKPVT